MAMTRQAEKTSSQNPDHPMENPIELAVIIPTYNEADNVEPLLGRLKLALAGISWEAIFVDDDSPDGTAAAVRAIALRDRRVRVIHRIGRRGLSSAGVEGVLSSAAPYLAVIDGDLQHDETLLPEMLRKLKQERLDIVVGSRHASGGGVGDWSDRRKFFSRVASQAAKLILKADLKDPMSGFFLMRREAFDAAVRKLSQQGFKILLDLFASAPEPLKFAELPYVFRRRVHGESKLDSMAAWEYGMLLIDKLIGHVVPSRFILFGVVGGFGILVHLAALGAALHASITFAVAQTIAVLIAMTSNFALNNMLTYRDRRLSGWRFLTGLLSFYAICSMGAVANVAVASLIYAQSYAWWLAGVAGAVVGAVWNYAVTSFYTWRRP
jgi:dolichol-phosphate mannosyltransferase